MIEKSKGIVLHNLKYTDSGIIAQLYTLRNGRQSFLIRGLRNRKSGKQIALFQPLTILEIEFNYRESRSMQMIKDISVFYSPAGIFSNIKKSGVAIFLGEILTSVLREEAPNPGLFEFIEDSIVYFDRCTDNFANFHIAFLAGLSSFLGFEPVRKGSREDNYFDMINGSFTSVPPLHGNYAGREVSEILSAFFSTSYDGSRNITLNGIMRNKTLETLVKYYSIHLPGLKKIRSLDVLREVFE